MTTDLNGSIIITGGAGGIGAQTARRLASAGAAVVVADVAEEAGRALATELGGSCLFVPLDVTSESQWADAVEAAERVAPLRGLVNNAGVLWAGRLVDETARTFSRMLEVNLVGSFNGIRAVASAMTANGGGSIVNLSSTAGLAGSQIFVAYSTSKWGVRGLSKSAAMELGGRGIRVNSVHPGPINTPMLGEDRAERPYQHLALGRMGEPTEVAELIAFLLSDASSYVTGAEITVDGGLSLGRRNSDPDDRATSTMAVI